jgi:hypothetical protein
VNYRARPETVIAATLFEENRRDRYHSRIVGEPEEEASVATEGADPGGPLSALRGAGVSVDARRVGRVAIALCLATMAVVAVILFVAGADKNAQINELRTQGVTIKITVTGCMGLLGGSGSNAAGYACRGTYTFRGHRYDEAIPGNVDLIPRSTLPVVIARSEPGLVSTVQAVREEHTSWRVFIAPAVLALLDIVAIALLLVKRRRSPGAGRRSGLGPDTEGAGSS